MDEIKDVLAAIEAVGQWAVFFYLYLSEKRAHETTRQQYRDDLRRQASSDH